MFVHPICLYGPVYSYTPICPPILLSASVCSERHLHVVGGCKDPLHVGHLPYMLDTSPHMADDSTYVLPPLIAWIPCVSVCFREYLHVMWGILPLCWGLGGIPPYVGVSASLSSFGVWQDIHWVSILIYLVTFL